MTVEHRKAREALELLPYGLYVLGSAEGKRPITIVANWVMQVSFRPQILAVAIEKDSRMHRGIETSGAFSVNILPSGSTGWVKAFLRTDEGSGATIHGKTYRRGVTGSPLLDDAIASVECSVQSELDAGDHVVYLGVVTDAVVGSTDRNVLTLKETGWSYQK